jgi:hypothetical protein
MPMMILNLALCFVFGFAPRQLALWHRENLFHSLFEFIGRILLGRCWHVPTICCQARQRNLLSETRQAGGFVSRLAATQQFKLDLPLFSKQAVMIFGAWMKSGHPKTYWLRDFLFKLCSTQLQFRRGHGMNFIVRHSAAENQKGDASRHYDSFHAAT